MGMHCIDDDNAGIDNGISDAASGIEMIMTLGAFYQSDSWLLANNTETNTNTNENENTNTHGGDNDTGSFLSFQ